MLTTSGIVGFSLWHRADALHTVNPLLAGTFHEIQPMLRLIEIEKIRDLHQSKLNIYQIERDLGLIP